MEFNPFAAHLPEDQASLMDYFREQQQILRQQHNKSQAGDTTFPAQLLTQLYPSREYTLGCVGRFFHQDFGIILARFCQLDSMVDSTNGCPVGFLSNKKPGAVDWKVTNDFSKSGADLAAGIAFSSFSASASGQYCWVVTTGANLLGVQRTDAGAIQQLEEFVWGQTGQLDATADGVSVGYSWAQDPTGTLSPGALFINLEKWSRNSLKALIESEVSSAVVNLNALTDRVSALETRATQTDQQIASVQVSIADLLLRLATEEQTRQSQIESLQILAGGNADFGPALSALASTLRAEYSQADQVIQVQVTDNSRRITNVETRLNSLDLAGINTQLANIGVTLGALGNISTLLSRPTGVGYTLISEITSVDTDGNPTYAYVESLNSLDALSDVDSGGALDGQTIVFDSGSGLWLPGNVGIQHAPSDSNLYASRNGDWEAFTIPVIPPIPDVPDVPPNDGQMYGMKNGVWTVIP